MSRVAKTPKIPKAPNPAIKKVIDAFHVAFLARFGFKPVIHGGKDGAHIQKLLATWDEETVLWLVAEFFATTDPRVLRSDYSLGALFSLAQHLLLRHQKGALTDERTAQNFDAASRASRPGQR